MSQLSLALLGIPEIRHAGHVITFPTRKALALLIYLALEEGIQPREKIATLFWPDSSSAQGRTVLRRALADLRHALGDDLSNRPAQPGWSGEHVWSNRESIRFNSNAEVNLDLHQVRAAALAAREWPLISASFSSASPSSHAGQILSQLQTAATLYRGDFLEGFSLSDAPEFDNWASMHRENWHRQITPIFEWLSQFQFDGGQLPPAIEITARWVAHDSLNEAAHRRLMQLHFAAGDRSAALRAYERCRALLQRELKAEPAPETVALARRIRSQTEPVRAAKEAAQTPLMADAPLIGRASEHHQLVATFRLSRRGQFHVVSIVGEPGIGKTRLAQEFLAWAAAQGADVLPARAFELGGQVPYQPVIEALRSRLRQEADPRRWLSDTWLAELSRLLPELSERLPNLPMPQAAGDGEARSRLFEAVARLGRVLADSAPLVLFIDDLQWADASSLELLQYAARRWTESQLPVMLLVTLRSEELAMRPLLGEWLDPVARDVAVTRVHLGALTYDDTREWLRAVDLGAYGLPFDRDAFSLHLFEETQGQPFFIVQTLKELGERGAWLRSAADNGAADFPHWLPRGVRALIQSRLARLSSYARSACLAAAVLGDGFDLERLCVVAGLGEREGLSALEELLARGLLRAAGPLHRFEHDKIREVAYAELSEARRRVLHRRALEASAGAGAPPAQLVRHALAGGLPARAFELSMAAGAAAMQLSAAREALTHFTQARDLLEEPARVPPADQQQLYLQLGRAYELTHEWDMARATYAALVARAREWSQPIGECIALNRLATVMAQGFFDLPTAATVLSQAQHVAEGSQDKLGLAETAWNLAHMGLYAWDGERSLPQAERALVLARELDQRELIARSLNAIAWAHLMLGQTKLIEAHAAEAQALYAQLGDRAMEIDCLGLVSMARIYDGRPNEAVRTARAANKLSHEIGNEWGQANSAAALAGALLDCGEFTEALAQAQAAVGTARRASHVLSLVYSLATLGDVYRAVFALEHARTTHLEAWDIAERLRNPYSTEMVASALCADHALAADWTAAHTFASQARAVRHYAQLYPGFTRALETEALLRGGDVEHAGEDLMRMGEQAAKLAENQRYRMQYLRARAVWRGWHSESEQAIQDLQAAAELALTMGLPSELWQIHAALGRLHHQRSNAQAELLAQSSAHEIIQWLAAKIQDASLRASFISGSGMPACSC